jgi:hypothetical protein
MKSTTCRDMAIRPFVTVYIDEINNMQRYGHQAVMEQTTMSSSVRATCPGAVSLLSRVRAAGNHPSVAGPWQLYVGDKNAGKEDEKRMCP